MTQRSMSMMPGLKPTNLVSQKCVCPHDPKFCEKEQRILNMNELIDSIRQTNEAHEKRLKEIAEENKAEEEGKTST